MKPIGGESGISSYIGHLPLIGTSSSDLRRSTVGKSMRDKILITSHTLLEKRLALILQAKFPDYVLILIGTNDM
jgi:lysophospholipase L1-like esterase